MMGVQYWRSSTSSVQMQFEEALLAEVVQMTHQHSKRQMQCQCCFPMEAFDHIDMLQWRRTLNHPRGRVCRPWQDLVGCRSEFCSFQTQQVILPLAPMAVSGCHCSTLQCRSNAAFASFPGLLTWALLAHQVFCMRLRRPLLSIIH